MTNLLSSLFVPDLVDLFTKKKTFVEWELNLFHKVFAMNILQDFSTSKYN